MLEPSLDRLRHGETQGLRPTDDRCRHVTKEQFKQIVKEIIRDIKLRSALEVFERWSPPKGVRTEVGRRSGPWLTI
jgi:hypothetical protein